MSALPAADTAAASGSESFRGSLGPLCLLTLLFFMNFMARIVQAPLMPAIEEDLHLSHAQAGSLFFILSVGYFIALMGSGFVSARITHRGTMALSIASAGMALLATAASDTLWGVRAGLFLTGLCTGLYLPSAIAAITEFVSPRHWGKAIAVHEAAPNLAFVLAPIFSEALLARVAWPAVLAVLGAGAVLSAAFFLRYCRVGAFAGEAPNLRSIGILGRQPSYWLMILLFGFGISGSLGLYTMLPLFLVSTHGLARDYANTLLAVSRIPGVLAAFGSGWFTDRIGPKRTMIVVLALNGLLTMILGVAPTAWLPCLVFIQPALAVCFFPAGFAAIGRMAPAGARNIAVSMTTPFAFMIGAGAVPALIGWSSDLHSFSAGFLVVGGLILAGGLMSRLLTFGRRPAGGAP
ncbi:MAG: MFS transporter [Desulfobacterales bacterium]|jgi:NNP family nitrate/nitrite transporter-like MFS transporter|nr:MFS transporter [Desulfobacterales bacterium]